MPRPRKIKPIEAQNIESGINIPELQETAGEPKKTTYFSKYAQGSLASLYENNAEVSVTIGTIKAKAIYKQVAIGQQLAIKVLLNDEFGHEETTPVYHIAYTGQNVVDIVAQAVNDFNEKHPQDEQFKSINHVERKVDLYSA